MRLLLARSGSLAAAVMVGSACPLSLSAQERGAVRIEVAYLVTSRLVSGPGPFETRYTISATLSEGGRVVDTWEGTNRVAQRRGEQTQQLGNRWRVIGRNQLMRVTDWPNSQTILTVTTSGKSCRATVQSRLRPGQTVHRFRRLTTGELADFAEPRYSDISCSIS